MPFDDNATRALSCYLGCGDCGHVDPAAETISGEQDVGIVSRLDWKRTKVVDADANAGPFWQGIYTMGQRSVRREVLRAWHFEQLRSHHQMEMVILIHQ